MMNISDWQMEQLRKTAKILKDEGYKLESSSEGYSVWFKDTFITGACRDPRATTKRHYKHKQADARDFFANAVQAALRHQSKS